MHSREKKIYKVTLAGSAVNAVLIALKFIAGILGRSSAMVADAVHSLSDFVTDIIVLVFVRISGKPHDKTHDYGHGKFETLATLIIGLILIGAGAGLMAGGISLVIDSLHGHSLPRPTWLALSVAAISVVSKEILYRYTIVWGNRLDSPAVVANAWHHRSDALSSIGAFVGIGGARMGFPILDPIASVVICLFILKAAYDVFKDAVDKMVDKSCDTETEEKIRDLICRQQGVVRVDELRTRLFGAKMYVDVEIAADGERPLRETHAIAENVHDCIEKEFPMVKHCMVHVNPADEEYYRH